MTDKPNDPWVLPSGAKIKAWFLIRLDLPMSQGKFGIQIGHGTDMIHLHAADDPYYAQWIDSEVGNRRKIALRAKDLTEVEKVKAECDKAGLKSFLIKDAGLTEFGEETITGLVVLPHDDSLIPNALKRAQSWRPTDGHHPEEI
jgi:peptidyl-tRNA hydrolase